MFETLKEDLLSSLGITVIIVFTVVFVVFTLAMFFKPTAVQSVEIHDMPSGVTCYTFNTSIDCLQVDR